MRVRIQKVTLCELLALSVSSNNIVLYCTPAACSVHEQNKQWVRSTKIRQQPVQLAHVRY